MDGATGKARFQGVVGRLGFAFRRRRAGGELRIGAIGFELSGSGHKRYFRLDSNMGANGETGKFGVSD